MSAGHTPGPWTLLVGRGVEVFDNFGEFIMSMNRPSDEVMANARLIAAAPELLSELKAHQQALSMLLDALEIDAEGTCFNFKAGDGSLIAKITFSELQSRSVAAIAKATGATP